MGSAASQSSGSFEKSFLKTSKFILFSSGIECSAIKTTGRQLHTLHSIVTLSSPCNSTLATNSLHHQSRWTLFSNEVLAFCRCKVSQTAQIKLNKILLTGKINDLHWEPLQNGYTSRCFSISSLMSIQDVGRVALTGGIRGVRHSHSLRTISFNITFDVNPNELRFK